jgi:hypothetical protein
MADPVGTVRQLKGDLEKLGVRGLRVPSDEEIRTFIDPSLYQEKGKQIPARLSPAQRKLRGRDGQIQDQREKANELQQAVERRDRQIQEQQLQIESLQRQFKEAQDRWKNDLAKLGKWSDRLAQDLGRLLKSNRWHLGCWLSLKRAGRRSKEAWPFGLKQAGGSADELLSFLEDHSFSLFLPGANGLLKFDRSHASTLEPAKYFNLFAEREASHPRLRQGYRA